jgi:hypothetical protein
LPGSITGALESQINARLNSPALTQVGGHHYSVTSVTTRDGSVTITLRHG